MEEGKRQVLNAFVGMTNIIDEEKIDEVMIKTFDDILNILSDYCGPYGKFAVLTNPENPTAQPTFTKDGLNIIRAIEFISPMEKHVKDTMAYIAQRVERASGDSTTSSMIMVAAIMKSLKEKLSHMDKVCYRDFVEAYQIFAKRMLELIDALKITPISSSDLHNIAMAQAMSSSHGNTELSKKVAQLYSSTPKQAWEYVVFERERRETSEEIAVKVDDSDYSCKARIFDNRFYNSAHGDSFSIEGSKVIFALGQMISNSLEFVNIKREINKAIEDNTKLVIIAPDSADGKVRSEIESIVGPKGNKNIGIFNVTVYNPTINDHVGMLTTFGVQNIKDDQLAIFEDVKVTFKEGRLSIFNIVEQTNDMLHPDFHDEDSKLFKYLKAIEDYVEDYKTSTSSSMEADTLIKEARRIYNAILLQKQGRIVIGGAAYDNEALVDVVQDTMKATRATLLEGATLGLYQTLKQAIGTILSTKFIKHEKLIESIASSFSEGVDKLCECSERHLPRSMKAAFRSALVDGGVYNVAIKCRRSLSDCHDNDKCVGVVLQPSTVDKELIKRFGEVALKFMFTNRVIIPGGVVVNKQEG